MVQPTSTECIYQLSKLIYQVNSPLAGSPADLTTNPILSILGHHRVKNYLVYIWYQCVGTVHARSVLAGPLR